VNLKDKTQLAELLNTKRLAAVNFSKVLLEADVQYLINKSEQSQLDRLSKIIDSLDRDAFSQWYANHPARTFDMFNKADIAKFYTAAGMSYAFHKSKPELVQALRDRALVSGKTETQYITYLKGAIR
jgi:hypothetical protein